MRCRRPGIAPNHQADDVRESSTVAARHRFGGQSLLSLVALSALLAACSGGTQAAKSGSIPAAPETTVTAAPTTLPAVTSTTVDPKQQVIAAYEDYVHQYQRVAGDPNGNPSDALLVATMTARMAEQVRPSISELRTAHQYTKGNLIVQPQNVTIQGSSATLLTCNRDDGDLFDQSGRDISTHPGIGTPQVLMAMLVLSPSGRWLVDQNTFTGKACTI